LVSGIWALFLPVIIIGGFRSGSSRQQKLGQLPRFTPSLSPSLSIEN
jgi:hypothetical protein